MGTTASKTTPVQHEVPVMHDCYKYYELQISEGGRVVFTCDGCKMNGIGPRYVCTLCDSILHKGCMYPKPTFSPHYFNGSTFTFTRTPPLQFGEDKHTPVMNPCAACREPVCGFSYRCEDRNLSLHPACSKIDKKIHFGDKILNLCTKPANCILPSYCTRCHKPHMNEEKGVFYVSSCNENLFHLNCLVEMMHDFYMENEDVQRSSMTINKAVTPEVDLSHVIESKMKNENGCTAEKVFVDFLTAGVDTNSPKIEEDVTATGEPVKEGIFRRISNFFKTMYKKVISGVTICGQKVWNAATSFSFKVTHDLCDKIADFIKLTCEFSKAILPYLKEGSFITAEILHKLSKALNLDFTTDQCQKIFMLLQLALKMFGGPFPM